ncbi:alpha-2-antiplasmin isoform X1 [Rhea pennata]|uniref:alpha-2-antiplasmin isoform X1 n=1 Tax=Rhea pennata TaxID=8795 RepID=UPI002E259F59
MVLLWGLLLLCLPALHSHLQLPLTHAFEQKHLSLDKAVESEDLEGAGAVQLDMHTVDTPCALPEAAPTLLNAEALDSTSDAWEEIYRPTLPFTTTTTRGSRNDWSPEEVHSSEEEDEGEDKNCDVTWKKSQRLTKGLIKFSIDLLREVQLETNRANVILSPLSITLALSHLALGAANLTEKRLLEVMHLTSVPCLHYTLSNVRRRLAESLLSAASRVYLQKGFWRNKFDASLTGPDIFHLDNDFMVPVEMMKAQKYSLSWFTLESQDVQVAKFPFKGNMSFLAIVPNQFSWNVSHVLENFPYEQLRSLFPKEVPTTVKIPKLKVDYQLELNKVLSQIGLQELFTNPDLQKITDEPLFVSSIQHQSTLELKEDGVEASAATSVMVSRSLSAFSLDRPFLFIIFEEETGIPLFIGSIQNPNPSAAPQIKETQDLPDATDVTEYPVPK